MIVADRYTTEAYGNFTDQYLVSVAYLVRENVLQFFSFVFVLS